MDEQIIRIVFGSYRNRKTKKKKLCDFILDKKCFILHSQESSPTRQKESNQVFCLPYDEVNEITINNRLFHVPLIAAIFNGKEKNLSHFRRTNKLCMS